MTTVDHPQHYVQGKREAIDLLRYFDFSVGNALKYIIRAPYKGNPSEDYAKAAWYLRYAHEHLPEVGPDLDTEAVAELAKEYDDPLVPGIVRAVSDWYELGEDELLTSLIGFAKVCEARADLYDLTPDPDAEEEEEEAPEEKPEDDRLADFLEAMDEGKRSVARYYYFRVRA